MSKESCWIWWRNKGYSPKATAAILGNIQPESAFRSNNVQDNCPLSDVDYTAKVDNGTIGREQFSRDEYGYGLYQHTYWSRKQGLFDLCKKKKKSISNENCQHIWAEKELHQAEYSRVYNKLKSDASLAEMTREFMLYFEKPQNQSESAIAYRVRLATAIYNEFAGKLPPEKTTYWSPRTIDKNMTGADVEVLQAVLKARGYDINYISGKFDGLLDSQVRRFQSDNGLVVDGIVGNKTWTALLNR